VFESSETIRARVQVARDLQNTRFCGHSSTEVVSNADIRIMEIGQFCRLQVEKQKQLDEFSSSYLDRLA
jgi:predicted ATPase with chaperone activity